MGIGGISTLPRKKKPLSDILGYEGDEVIDIDIVEPAPRPMLPAPASIPVPAGIDKEAEDIENARKIRYELIASGQEILRDLMAFAVASEAPQAPRAYEVLTSHMANLNAMVQSMTDLAQKAQKEKKVESPGTTNNIMFVGTNQEFQKMLKKFDDEPYKEKY
jgi:hypothetical protein